jgi:hypothetical protein
MKLSRFLIKHHAMKRHGGVEGKLHAFITSAIDEGEESASRHGRAKSPRYPMDRRR